MMRMKRTRRSVAGSRSNKEEIMEKILKSPIGVVIVAIYCIFKNVFKYMFYFSVALVWFASWAVVSILSCYYLNEAIFILVVFLQICAAIVLLAAIASDVLSEEGVKEDVGTILLTSFSCIPFLFYYGSSYASSILDGLYFLLCFLSKKTKNIYSLAEKKRDEIVLGAYKNKQKKYNDIKKKGMLSYPEHTKEDGMLSIVK